MALVVFVEEDAATSTAFAVGVGAGFIMAFSGCDVIDLVVVVASGMAVILLLSVISIAIGDVLSAITSLGAMIVVLGIVPAVSIVVVVGIDFFTFLTAVTAGAALGDNGVIDDSVAVTSSVVSVSVSVIIVMGLIISSIRALLLPPIFILASTIVVDNVTGVGNSGARGGTLSIESFAIITGDKIGDGCGLRWKACDADD